VAWKISLGLLLAAAGWAADATRGAQLITEFQCLACHNISGKGGKTAPDLGRRFSRDYTPAGFASLMWNHAPAMWKARAARKLPEPKFEEADALDLAAYLSSLHFFAKPGNSAQGREKFETRRCSACHGLAAAIPGGGPAVGAWASVTDITVFIRQIWNHSGAMRERFRAKSLQYPRVTGQDLADVLAFLERVPDAPARPPGFSLGSPSVGLNVLRAKGCLECHVGERAFEKTRAGSLAEIAASMWNHPPLASARTLSNDEMRQVLGYLWQMQFRVAPGDATRGKSLFVFKGCAGCHAGDGGRAPDLSPPGREITPAYMVAALWKHGPGMLKQMNAEKTAWPRFEGSEFADLLAYMNRR
jgi:mono/diheme cytochrome c family protein